MRYVLVVLQTGRGGNAKLAMRTAGGMSITGFANGKDDWFALPGGRRQQPPRRHPHAGPGQPPECAGEQ